MNKKILLITNIFPPVIGGPATFIDRLGHALVSRGYSVTVICSSATGRHESDAARPFRVRRIVSRAQIELIAKSLPIMIWEMLRHDKILVNGNELAAWLSARLAGRKYVLKIVGDTVWETARNNGNTALDIEEFQSHTLTDSSNIQRIERWRKHYLGAAQKIITPSVFLQKIVAGWGVPVEKIQVIYNGILHNDYRLFQPRTRASGNLRVAFVGRLTNWKGVETLLLAASRLTGIEVNIIGEGAEYPLLMALAGQLGLNGKVVFTGSLEQTGLKESLSTMDVLVLGSSYEGLSHTLLEASAMGLACISSDRGGNPEIITHGETGLLFPYGDVQALCDALVALRDDEKLRYRLACSAKAAISRFDFNHTVEQTIQCILGS
jgi:glycosyltransferase involved in cell wall biosynthesis